MNIRVRLSTENVIRDLRLERIWEIVYDIFSFPLRFLARGIDKIVRLFWGRKIPHRYFLLDRCRRSAFKKSIELISAVPGKEIKFVDRRNPNKDDYLGWAILTDGVLDINYKVKKRQPFGPVQYLTKFSGDDVLDMILRFFDPDEIKKIECLLQNSNLEAFNLAYAKVPGNYVYAIEQTHFGSFIVGQKKWRISKESIQMVGTPGPMRSDLLEPAKANFHEVSVVFLPPAWHFVPPEG